MTHQAKDAAGGTLTFKSGTSSGELVPYHHVESVPVDPFGNSSDAAVSAGAAGSISAKLRTISAQLSTAIAFANTSAYYLLSAAGTNRNQIKTSSGTVYGWSISNASAAAYVKLYDVTSTGAGTTAMTPKVSVRVNASDVRDYSILSGIKFSSGISIAIVAGAGQVSSPVGASDVIANVFFT